MQKLFAEMLISNVKYQDPTKVLESIVDDNGQKIEIYLQADICEFFLNFLDRLQDGLGCAYNHTHACIHTCMPTYIHA